MLTAEKIEQEAKEWCDTGLLDESDKRAVTSFARWLIKLASESTPPDNSLTDPSTMGFRE